MHASILWERRSGILCELRLLFKCNQSMSQACITCIHNGKAVVQVTFLSPDGFRHRMLSTRSSFYISKVDSYYAVWSSIVSGTRRHDVILVCSDRSCPTPYTVETGYSIWQGIFKISIIWGRQGSKVTYQIPHVCMRARLATQVIRNLIDDEYLVNWLVDELPVTTRSSHFDV